MTAGDDVAAAALARAEALAARDGPALRALLHPLFVWTSHTGQVFDRESYVAANTGAGSAWLGQTLLDVRVQVAGPTAVLTCVVTDEIRRGEGRELFRMPVTQTWVREASRWVCLAGHAGPRLES